MPVVSVQKSASYDEVLLDRVIAAHFEALRVADDLKPGMKVLLKPNLLTGRDPATAVTATRPFCAPLPNGCARTALSTSPLRTAPAVCIRPPRCARCMQPVS